MFSVEPKLTQAKLSSYAEVESGGRPTFWLARLRLLHVSRGRW